MFHPQKGRHHMAPRLPAEAPSFGQQVEVRSKGNSIESSSGKTKQNNVNGFGGVSLNNSNELWAIAVISGCLALVLG